MIFKIRDKLKDADQNECFTTLFKYPEIKDIMDIIKLSKKVEQAINERLNGKNSNVYDILGIMKPIESQPSHLFSPHMNNQTNKINTYSNNINNNKNINNFENNKNKNYENFDEDEEENINLDSIEHKNDNDLGSQAKSFINNALNSLSNFGGIIKDQLQNAKDTVIDSFKGNDSINNYNNNNYNDYEENNYQKSNYNDNDYYNNLGNNNINNENQNENEQQNEEIKSNEEMRKASIDSQNELVYNRQDINDIVGKLKEIDTKYNMFFNDEDKRNLRIIIDYLKKKI